jgi:hypothetical protein
MLRMLRTKGLSAKGWGMANSEAVERAVRALKALCGPQTAPEEEQESAVTPGQSVPPTSRPAKLLEGKLAECGSPHCGGCYDVGDGRKIHPPKCGEDYLGWFKRWEGRGCRMQ